jgi:hypothetical protein
MPTFHVKDPSGAVYEVTGPEGSTEQDALAQVQRSKSLNPDTSNPSAVLNNWAANNPIRQLGNVQRGAVDVIGGGAQLLARGANALGIPPTDNPALFPSPQVVSQQNAQARANIDQMFGPQQPGLTDTAVRGVTAGILTSPLAPTKFLQAPTLLSRSLGGGVAGATSNAIQEVPDNGTLGDFAKRKGLQAGAGFVGGVLSQPIAETVVKGVVSALNGVADRGMTVARNLTGANSIDNIVSMTRAALQKTGIDYDKLDEAVKQGLLNDVQTALKSSSAVNPGAVARQAAFRQEGFDPLAPWITRDPTDYTAVENLSHMPGIGAPLMQRKAALDQHVLDRLNGLRGAPQDPQAAGSLAIKDLNGFLTGQQSKTGVLYDTFKDIAPNVTGDPQRFANDLFDGLEGQMAGASLPGGLRSIVNDISAGKIPLTPSTLYQLQKMANGARGADGSANYALGHLSRAIDRELGRISASVGPTGSTAPVAAGTALPDQQGQYAADVLKMARGQHAQTMGALESSPILNAAVNGKIAPENFVDRLSNASIDETKSVWAKLSPDAQTAVRSQVFTDLKNKAFGNASDSAGKPAAQATFVNYVNDPANAAKLRIVLGDDGYEQAKRLGVLLEAAKMQPAGSAVNNSKTGGAVVSAAFRLSNGLKDLGIWGGTPLSTMANKSAVQNAMAAPGEALGQKGLLVNPFLEEILARRVGRGTSLLGGPLTYQGMTGLLGQPTQ